MSDSSTHHKIAEGERRFTARNRRIAVDKRQHTSTAELTRWTWYPDENGVETWTHRWKDIEESLKAGGIRCRTYDTPPAPSEADRLDPRATRTGSTARRSRRSAI